MSNKKALTEARAELRKGSNVATALQGMCAAELQYKLYLKAMIPAASH